MSCRKKNPEVPPFPVYADPRNDKDLVSKGVLCTWDDARDQDTI